MSHVFGDESVRWRAVCTRLCRDGAHQCRVVAGAFALAAGMEDVRVKQTTAANHAVMCLLPATGECRPAAPDTSRELENSDVSEDGRCGHSAAWGGKIGGGQDHARGGG